MTLQQLKYVITVAETGTITEAANQLFISQPSLTNAIHELEKEMNIVIFNRTNKGISLSKEGEGFLGYARQVLEQAAILEDKYKRNGGGKKQFCVSTQHYSFAVNAFVDLIKEYGQEEYDFSLRETQTYEIIEDVARLRSEIGILFLNDFNEAVINKMLKSYDLEFHLLFIAKPHVFISRSHPLAEKKVITNQELEIYPYLSFEQGEHNSFYFSEEIFSESERKKNIRVRDSAKERAYKSLLNDQLDWCNDNFDAITIKAEKLYKIVTETPDKMKNLTKRCCDFKKLELVLEKRKK